MIFRIINTNLVIIRQFDKAYHDLANYALKYVYVHFIGVLILKLMKMSVGNSITFTLIKNF